MLRQSGLGSTTTWMSCDPSSPPMAPPPPPAGPYRHREPSLPPGHPRAALLLRLFFQAEVARLRGRLQVVLRLLHGPGVAGVDFLVAIQGLLVAKVLPADGALVGGLPGVHPPVLEEVVPSDEALPALGALVGPLPRVDALVPDGFGEVSEVLPAVGAGERPVAFPRVELLVQDEADLQAEALLALRAGVRPLHHVVGLVPDEAVLESRALLRIGALGRLGAGRALAFRRAFGFRPEALPGLQGRAGFLPRVRSLMGSEELLVQEALPALAADVRPLHGGRFLGSILFGQVSPAASRAPQPVARGGSLLRGRAAPALAARFRHLFLRVGENVLPLPRQRAGELEAVRTFLLALLGI